jgi:hypothetical protein
VSLRALIAGHFFRATLRPSIARSIGPLPTLPIHHGVFQHPITCSIRQRRHRRRHETDVSEVHTTMRQSVPYASCSHGAALHVFLLIRSRWRAGPPRRSASSPQYCATHPYHQRRVCLLKIELQVPTQTGACCIAADHALWAAACFFRLQCLIVVSRDTPAISL